MTGTDTIERARTARPGTGHDANAFVVVLNDHHNTFEGVAAAIARIVPGVDYSGGMALATQIHQLGRARVWAGPLEVAELYWEQLRDSGLTMAPIERG